MKKAEDVAAALVVINDNELYLVGGTSDIQRLHQAGFVDRAWDIRLDNGHRPYPIVKKRVDYDITEPANDYDKNSFTQNIARMTGVDFAHSIHPVTQTYLFRETPKFYADLFVGFSEGSGLPQGVNPENYYAIYRGCILPGISSIKFSRQ